MDIEFDKQAIGVLINPCMLCELGIDIYEGSSENKKLIYRLRASICQAGWLCKEFPCKSCQELNLVILDTDGK
jgi:hypothetical protein